jgi:hypothetical protein
MPGAPFGRIPYIQKQRGICARQLFCQLRCAEALCSPYQVRSVRKRLHGQCEIAFDMIEANAAEPHRSFQLAAGFSNDDDRLGPIEYRASPGRILPSETNIDAPPRWPFPYSAGSRTSRN